jgi:hypothetical protein
MRSCFWIGLLVIAATGTGANAIVITVASTSDTLTINNYGWDGVDLTLSETVTGPHASLAGDVSGDPLVWVRKSVENNTNFAWSAYQIDVTMPGLVAFTIPQLVPMAGWTVTASPVIAIDANTWGATILYSVTTGSMVQPTTWGDFDFQLWIPAAVRFTVNQTPIAPEPVSLALLALGGLLIRRKRR